MSFMTNIRPRPWGVGHSILQPRVRSASLADDATRVYETIPGHHHRHATHIRHNPPETLLEKLLSKVSLHGADPPAPELGFDPKTVALNSTANQVWSLHLPQRRSRPTSKPVPPHPGGQNLPLNQKHSVAPDSVVIPPVSKRARTGVPFVDGLTGVEPNPGPPKTTKNRHTPNRRRRSGNDATSLPRSRVGGTLARSFASAGTVSRGANRNAITVMGTRNVMGSPATIIRGSCMFQTLVQQTDQTVAFNDGTTFASQAYLNPRICCQNNNYDVPAGVCPISVVAQPWRRFCFLACKVHYLPLATSTNVNLAVTLSYDPEVVINGSPTSYLSAALNMECSMTTPAWQPASLDITPYLDRSKWFYSETNNNLGASGRDYQSIQGTIMLHKTSSVWPANENIGFVVMEFELALSELGPTTIYVSPTVSQPPAPTSSSSAATSASATSSASTSPDYVRVDELEDKDLEHLKGVSALLASQRARPKRI